MLTDWVQALPLELAADAPGGAAAAGDASSLKASYDNAATSDENSRHWVHADGLSARRANSPAVRKTLRDRSRYEVSNNSYASGIVATLANNLVGRGPRLQLLTPSDQANRAVEARFAESSRAVRLPDKIRTAKRAKSVDGEGIGLLTTNPLLPCAVQLDVLLIEADQMADLFTSPLDLYAVDGLRFDPHGNVTEYHFLPHHPGDWYSAPLDVRRVSPRNVLHWYRRERPGQYRGVPELTPALGLFAQLRRMTLATLTAAETAASFAAVLKSQAPPNVEADAGDPWQSLAIERGMMTQLPAGWELTQFRSEHPATTYEMFVWCILREICRCLNLPLNIALGDSSKSNFSSARLDHLVYRQAVQVEREDCEREFLGPFFAAWLREATLIPGYLPANLPADPAALPHCWHWPPFEAIDQKTEADADAARLASGTATLPQLAAEQGRDWRDMVREAVQVELYRDQVRRELGAPAPEETEVSNATPA
jgi:lambda family phage portal protein